MMARKKRSGDEPEMKQPAEEREIVVDVSSDEGTPETAAEDETVTDEPCSEETLQNQIAELEDKLLRTAAEFENFRKRTARQHEMTVRAANDGLIVELLEVVDNFERALNHTENNTEFEAFHQGTELILSQMMNLLKKYDVTPIESVGQPFDPNLHEAVMQVESDQYGEGIVAMEMVKGYRQGERVLRHAKVGVSSGKKEDDES
ncbi:MAG: nucleotide exchange factor GrpE [Candidatus Zixiibacteriota bacterium]|nr:MAG: nucleotide exchange factor GrpE [candidate division Zixibacteria bacterium]